MNHVEFFRAIAEDPRITPLHISLYMALLYLKELRPIGELRVYSCEVMRLAKISSPNTYRKGMRDLDAFGYMIFEPSFDPAQGSKVILSERAMHSGGKDVSVWRNRSY